MQVKVKNSKIKNRVCVLCDHICLISNTGNIRAHFQTQMCPVIKKVYVTSLNNVLQHTCTVCTQIYFSAETMVFHILETHKTTHLQCCICLSYVQVKDIKQHKIAHLEDTDHKSIYCAHCTFGGKPLEFLMHVIEIHKFPKNKITKATLSQYLDNKNPPLALLSVMVAKETL